jgi:hypothetical protein
MRYNARPKFPTAFFTTYGTSTSTTAGRPGVGFVSLGCPKALVDPERILTQLKVEVTKHRKLRRCGRGRREYVRIHRLRGESLEAIARHWLKRPRDRDRVPWCKTRCDSGKFQVLSITDLWRMSRSSRQFTMQARTDKSVHRLLPATGAS